jgi:uncharacterized membrane protein YfcA
MGTFWLVLLGAASGTGAGLLAGLIGIGGGVVIVPVVFYGLIEGGTSADQAAHVAVGTSLAAILPAALVSSWPIGAPGTPTLGSCEIGDPVSPPGWSLHNLRHRTSAAAS